MKVIGVLTKDFRAYYDIVHYLKRNDLPFVSLNFEEPIPLSVGVVVTTKGEGSVIDFARIVEHEGDIEHTIAVAMRLLSGKERYGRVVVGIDPGDKPGIAVIGDDTLLETRKVYSPEDAVSVVEHATRSYPAVRLLVRIGHGDVTKRNRIINALSSLDVEIEIVDETRTTGIDGSDIKAAIYIASMQGRRAQGSFDVRPTEGELRDIQRRSRIRSRGMLTISQELAGRVAVGELTIDEALERQREDQREPPGG